MYHITDSALFCSLLNMTWLSATYCHFGYLGLMYITWMWMWFCRTELREVILLPLFFKDVLIFELFKMYKAKNSLSIRFSIDRAYFLGHIFGQRVFRILRVAILQALCTSLFWFSVRKLTFGHRNTVSFSGQDIVTGLKTVHRIPSFFLCVKPLVGSKQDNLLCFHHMRTGLWWACTM